MSEAPSVALRARSGCAGQTQPAWPRQRGIPLADIESAETRDRYREHHHPTYRPMSTSTLHLDGGTPYVTG
jgi:hypothetical protein